MLINTDFAMFRQSFESGLSEMLAPDELGAFILVLANSMQDEHLQQGLAPRLAATFAQLQERCCGDSLKGGRDDLEVFEALRKSGIERYRAWDSRKQGPWQIAFNPLRALRPQRASKERFQGLRRIFDEDGFHFDKPFLAAEILGEDSVDDQLLRVLYHKFPFVAYHLLILLDPAGHHPQFMTEWAHRLVWTLVARVASAIPGFGVAFNSLGASASVNHLHVHGFIQQRPYAIEHSAWRHNGGQRPYPVRCYRVDSASECWSRIEALHRDDQPYNLLFRTSACYVIPRPPQGESQLPAWLPDAGWYELCGGFNLVDHHAFVTLAEDDIVAALQQLRL